MRDDRDDSAGGVPVMMVNVSFPMKNVVLLAASFYILKQHLARLIEEIMRRKLWLIFCILWITPASAEAEKIRGLGLASCTKWTQDRREALLTGLASAELWGETQWTLGFISGSNVSNNYNADIAAQLTGDAILRFLDTYCKENPGRRISDASKSFLTSLSLNVDSLSKKRN